MSGFEKYSGILLLAATVMLAAAQQSSAGASPAPPADMHNSRNSLDWAGTYEGVLSCTACPGTKTRLTLNKDGSYRLVTTAQGSQNAEKSVSGVFTWQPSGNAIILDERGGRQQFSVGEGRLALLRPEGGASQSSPAANQVLRLTAAAPPSGDLEQQLERYRWTLVFATTASHRRIAGLPPGRDRPVVLSFAGSRMSVQGPCNRLVGGYQVTGADQLTANVGASTMMACHPALMKADSALSNLLAKPLRVRMTGRPSARLQLVSANGILRFTGEPTPESLYGPGTTVFLEIAAQSVACPNPPSPNARCLQFRERQYDDKGLPVGTPGEWRPLTFNIEGFTHREGIRNVLRVKQFQRPASEGGAPSNLYVLDMIVESETVKP
jgi:heat shock protein HslJ/uncharacterized lipoprotein NlpE involved in copper resistance